MSTLSTILSIKSAGNSTAFTKAELTATLLAVADEMIKFTVLCFGNLETMYINGVRKNTSVRGFHTDMFLKYNLPYESVEYGSADFPETYTD